MDILELVSLIMAKVKQLMSILEMARVKVFKDILELGRSVKFKVRLKIKSYTT